MNLFIIQGGFELGCIFTILSLGLFISFKILNIPDLTVDGSFTLGAACSAMLALAGHPFLGLAAALLCGALAGAVTGFLQTKLKVQYILSGILTMTGLYSINLRIMDKKPTISLFGYDSIFTPFNDIFGISNAKTIVLFLLVVLLICLMLIFLKTQLGLALRATGDNEVMVRASSINTDRMKILGLALANSLVALSGAVFAQHQSFADLNSGIGMMVIGLASIIIGESLINRKSLLVRLISVAVGAILYRYILTIALQFGIEASDLKLLSAILVTAAISIPSIQSAIAHRRRKGGQNHA